MKLQREDWDQNGMHDGKSTKINQFKKNRLLRDNDNVI